MGTMTEWTMSKEREIWLECRGDIWLRWSTVVRVEVVENRGSWAVVLQTDWPSGQMRATWKDAPTREEARKLLTEELWRWLRGEP